MSINQDMLTAVETAIMALLSGAEEISYQRSEVSEV